MAGAGTLSAPQPCAYSRLKAMLWLADKALTLVHLALIGFVLVGWLPRRTRRAHLIVAVLVAASWLGLGAWYGLGYCPLTDWQWQVRPQMGARDLPSSFIEDLLSRLVPF